MSSLTINGISKKVLLVILDGYGIRENTLKNAIENANKPFIDYIFNNYPFKTIISSGEEVGLPKGVMGNSEVGHLNIGSGRSVRQDLIRINEAIEQDTFKNQQSFLNFLEVAKKNNNYRIHLMGLLSDGQVHSHMDHLIHIAKKLKEHDEKFEIYLHAYMDGRDTPKQNGINYLKEILNHQEITIASIQGRSIGMDRDRRWEKIEHAYKTFIGQGKIEENIDPISYMQSQYDSEIYDEFITPVLLNKNFAFKEKDNIFFFNFRPDRAKQITLALNDPNFNHFKRSFLCDNFLCMTPYVQEELPKLPILFDKEKISGTLSEYLSSIDLKQFKIAETEKYAHVTYFFNGGEETPFKGEDRQLIESPKDVATYDLKPQMSAPEVLSVLKEKLIDPAYSFYLVNFANSDMVGHTGNYEAAIKAIETLNSCLEELYKVAQKENIAMLITADHGNSDQMIYEDGSMHTSHSTADVPFCIVHPNLKNKQLNSSDSQKFSLKDIAPTVLNALGKEIPSNFTGKSIFN